MTEQVTEERNGRLRTTIRIAAGEKVHLCRWVQSKEFPFCMVGSQDVPIKCRSCGC